MAIREGFSHSRKPMRPLPRKRFVARAFLIFWAPAIILFLQAADASARSSAPLPPRQTAASPQTQIPVDWNNALHSLAQKISGFVPSLAVSLDVKNISSLGPGDVANIRQALIAEMALWGNRVIEPSADTPQVHLTLSENNLGYLWIAEIDHGDMHQTTMAPVAIAPPPPSSPATPLMLQRKIVWQQSGPILDFAQETLTGGGTLWFLLEPGHLDVYAFAGEVQTVHQSLPIDAAGASRDPRGLLAPGENGGIQAYLGSTLCTGTWTTSLDLECSAGAGQNWPLGAASWTFEPTRNYFSGVTNFASGFSVKRAPFYSAASPPPELATASSSRWILAGLDGRARLFTGMAEPAAVFSNWGSGITTLRSACDSTWQVLVSGAGDWTGPDSIQVYDIADQRAVPAGQPLVFPGPVLALWPAADSKSARVVSRNLSTGLYEASILT
ncbi:MAG: hypothetical protein ACRD52_09740, partial [Candidatus Acidiferrales bacterium]